MQGWSRAEGGRASHVHRIVNPLGAVVSGASSHSPSPPGEEQEDSYIMSNQDEALFRPVVSAPRSLSLPPSQTPPTKPLSTNILLPVERIASSENVPLSQPPVTVADRIVIPARLSQTSLEEPSKLTVSSLTADKPKKLESKIKQVDANDISEDKCRESSPKLTKKKLKDRKKDEKNKYSQQTPSQNATQDQVSKSQESTTLKGNKNAISLDAYVDEISKAVENIEFFNNEIIPENSLPSIGTSRSHNSKSPKHKSKALECPTVKVCCDTLQDNLDVFDDVKTSPKDNAITRHEAISSQNTEVDKSDAKIKLSEDAAWEILADVNNSTKTKRDSDVKENVYLFEKSKISPLATSAIGDEIRTKKKRVKTIKSKISKNDDLSVEQESIHEDVNTNLTQSEKCIKPSWSAIISRDTKRNSEDSSSDTKVSSVYNRSNIVLALCDTPQTELCFVDEHHSMFVEPPPLEPLDLDLDDQKIQEMHDSLLDYTHTPTLHEVPSTNMCFDMKEFPSTFDCLKDRKSSWKKADDFISVDYNVSHMESIKKDLDEEMDDYKQYKDKLLVLMEKSSDEENASPSSSQTESDDCGNLANSGVNFTEEGEACVVAEEPLISILPCANAKSNKKKPKRKRR